MFRAEPGHAPVLSRLVIQYPYRAPAKLTLSGFKVVGPDRDLVIVSNASDVRLDGLHVSAPKWAVRGEGVDAMSIFDSNDVVVVRTTIEGVHRGIQVRGSSRVRILQNHIMVAAGSGIQYLGGNTQGEIAFNHIHGFKYVPHPENPDAPRDPHASIISFRSGDVVLRGNHLHGMGSSSGIMFYEPDRAGGEDAYSHVLIENNAIYDVSNTFALRVYNLGSDFVVRNNTFFPGLRTKGCDPRYRYDVAVIVHGAAESSEGIRLYNNVFVGLVSVKPEYIKEEANNVAWSWFDWVSESPSGTSRIVTTKYGKCDTPYDTLFEDGTFFRERIDPMFPERRAHDFSLGADSLGKNFGSAKLQPRGGIGPVGADGFVTLGSCRDERRHSVGSFEAPN